MLFVLALLTPVLPVVTQFRWLFLPTFQHTCKKSRQEEDLWPGSWVIAQEEERPTGCALETASQPAGSKHIFDVIHIELIPLPASLPGHLIAVIEFEWLFLSTVIPCVLLAVIQCHGSMLVILQMVWDEKQGWHLCFATRTLRKIA